MHFFADVQRKSHLGHVFTIMLNLKSRFYNHAQLNQSRIHDAADVVAVIESGVVVMPVLRPSPFQALPRQRRGGVTAEKLMKSSTRYVARPATGFLSLLGSSRQDVPLPR